MVWEPTGQLHSLLAQLSNFRRSCSWWETLVNNHMSFKTVKSCPTRLTVLCAHPFRRTCVSIRSEVFQRWRTCWLHFPLTFKCVAVVGCVGGFIITAGKEWLCCLLLIVYCYANHTLRLTAAALLQVCMRHMHTAVSCTRVAAYSNTRVSAYNSLWNLRFLFQRFHNIAS